MTTWNAGQWLRAFEREDADRRSLRAQVWANTLEIVQSGGYTLSDGTDVRIASSCRSRFYDHEVDTCLIFRKGYRTEITVVPNDCLDVAHAWVQEGLSVSVLNMASRQNPGGGVRNGAGAQEEYLFRCSDYYRAMYVYAPYAEEYGLTKSWERYPLDRNYGGIFTTDVTIFRSNEATGYALLKAPWKVNMIAVAGMNRPRLVKDRIAPELVEGVKNKIRTIFRIAVNNRQVNLVLGALGCGAFRNPPRHVAELFRDVLCEKEFEGAFQRICFAVKADHNSNGDANYLAFRDVLDGFVPVYSAAPALMRSGKMEDGSTWYEEYTDHTVKVKGYGSLVFNLRDFLVGDLELRYNVIAEGDFTEVGDSAFLDWYSLESVVLPRTIQKIRERAFSDCDNLTCITMPGHISTIGSGAFAYCGLKKVIFYDDIPVNDALIQRFKAMDVTLIWRGHEI